MSAKRKNSEKQNTTNAIAGSRRPVQAQALPANTTRGVEDYIWNVMQNYAAELRSGHRPNQRFV